MAPTLKDVQVVAGQPTTVDLLPLTSSSAVSTSILVVKLSVALAFLTAAIERSGDGMSWDSVASMDDDIEAGTSFFLVAPAVEAGFLRLRFTLNNGSAVLSVASHTSPLDPRERDDSVFRLASNNILRPWTTTAS